ncbi:MAG: FAD-dependent oxidoreductase [Parvibaculaceae bacterium]
MPRNPRYDILFEPVRIGPVTAPNRFYQVPHSSGMTNANPRVRAAFRETKAEGGWGVICTGACSIHPSADDSPFPNATLWDDADIRSHALMTEAVHGQGALAGVELWHGGAFSMQRTTRMPPLSPSGIAWMPTHSGFMSQQRPKIMDAHDIRELIRWQADGARRALSAGFDILYVYAGMGYLPHEFMLSIYNHRTDAYGGSVENRVRLTRQLIDATREATRGRCAVALRISLQELRARPGKHAESEAHEVIECLKDDPDLFDVKMDFSATDCAASRYTPEGSHESVVGFVKTITSKPVVGVGRFTSPDTMVSQVKRGVLDLIGGARPSIADPFLPRKISEGREEEIRECIGCNMCIASWHDGVWVRCTQNPTAGEEYRRGWHPEKVRRDGSGRALVVGGGPSGLEAALTLARRGYDVALADQRERFGGRLAWEAKLPGLGQWHRVVDYRLGRLREMPNVELFPASRLVPDDVLDFGAEHVVVATGARWLKMGYSPDEFPLGSLDSPGVYTPDDIAAGVDIEGPVAVFDFDSYYMGSAISERLALEGKAVTHVTPAGFVSAWTINTNELPLIHRSLGEKGVSVLTLQVATSFDGVTLALRHLMTGEVSTHPCRSLVVVGHRAPVTDLYDALLAREDDRRAAGMKTLSLTGDALAPGAIVHAVYNGHRTARELEVAEAQRQPLRDHAFGRPDGEDAAETPHLHMVGA